MKKSKNMLHILLLCGLALSLQLHAQDQSGFVSIDCGIPVDAAYTDSATGISYISDANFTDVGISRTISPEYQANSLAQQLSHVRSFPQGIRNCYTLSPPGGNVGSKYLIRAMFMYGNYDSKNQIPEFDIHIGVNVWDSVKLPNASVIIYKEMVHVLTSTKIYICMVNTGLGMPFVSALELRHLNSTIYVPQSGSLVNILRLNLGSTNNEFLRYQDDAYDRIWSPPVSSTNWSKLTTRLPIDTLFRNRFRLPQKVMQTAITPINNNDSLTFYWKPDDPSSVVYFYMHFAEVIQLKKNETREFNIYINRGLWYGPLIPTYSYTNTIYSTTPPTPAIEYTVTINKTLKSTLPPILNAVEIYVVKQLLQAETDQTEVDAVMNIKSMYGVHKNWQGDPCAPQNYSWEGLNCSYDGFLPPKIISLNVSSSNLTGEITPYISNLSSIQSLDLSNNKLTGPVPDFLAQLQSLQILILTGNNFTGSIPDELVQKSKNGLLSLSVDANICQSVACKNINSSFINNDKNNLSSSKKSSKKFIIPVVVAVVLLMFVAVAIFLFLKARLHGGLKGKVDNNPNQPLESKKRQLTYSEILTITNNLERVIGRGGFGTVYHGHLDQDTPVAVKILSESSVQGYEEFRTEAKLLMRVHHRNLTSLVGYCNEGTNLGLVYEYMENGNLEDRMSGKNTSPLSWDGRLQIAVDAAQGLEYLHHGCKPPIVHRDVKSTNILLNKELRAKLADFGMSRIFPSETRTHVCTRVIGTQGYLDPEYYVTNWLNEKSDVFSFGVVLLELVTGRPAIGPDPEKTHLMQWVSPFLENGEIRKIVDPSLQGEFEINSAWKAVELAMSCVSLRSSERPIMNHAVMELKECLALEKTRSGEENYSERINSSHVVPLNLDSVRIPMAR